MGDDVRVTLLTTQQIILVFISVMLFYFNGQPGITRPLEDLVRTSYRTFENRSLENALRDIQPLIQALDSCTSAHVNLHGSLLDILHPKPNPTSGFTICETEYFDLGVIIMQPGSKIPLHDHPGMFGAIKVIHGQVRVSSFTTVRRMEGCTGCAVEVKEDPPVILSSSSPPSILTPDKNNIHRVEYVKGEEGLLDFAVFIDIISPKYTETNFHFLEVRNSTISKTSDRTILVPCPHNTQGFSYRDIPYRGPNLKNIIKEENERIRLLAQS